MAQELKELQAELGDYNMVMSFTNQCWVNSVLTYKVFVPKILSAFSADDYVFPVFVSMKNTSSVRYHR